MDKVFSIIYRIKNILNKPITQVDKDYFITSVGVKMRNPIDKNGLWIGWTIEENVNHLASIKSQSGKK